MSKKISKRMSLIRKKIDVKKMYAFHEAVSLLKDGSVVRFIESVDTSINLGIDARKSDQNIRGSAVLPHGIGRVVRVAVFAQGEGAELAKNVGAEFVGMEDLCNQIKKNEIHFDLVLASPDTMRVVGSLASILGPRGLMPNLKAGTIVSDVVGAIKNAKFGQVRYRNDKNGIIHSTIGRINFSSIELKENLETLLGSIKKIKPVSAKGLFFKKISISTTMGVGFLIDSGTLDMVLN